MKQVPKQHHRGLVFISALVFALCAVSAAATVLTTSEAGPSVEFPSSFARARRFLDDGRIAEARAIYAAELKRDAKSIEALRGLALCARDEGDDESALQHLQKLTAISPQDRSAWRQLALASSRLGRDMEAVSAAQAALSLSPEGDRAMTDLLTRLLTSKESLANRMLEDPFGDLGPTGRTNSPSTSDPMSRGPKVKLPQPAQSLPKPGRGE